MNILAQLGKIPHDELCRQSGFGDVFGRKIEDARSALGPLGSLTVQLPSQHRSKTARSVRAASSGATTGRRDDDTRLDDHVAPCAAVYDGIDGRSHDPDEDLGRRP